MFEGIDGSGKTTVSRFIYDRLKKICSVKLTSEPFDRTVLASAEACESRFAAFPVSAIDCSALLFTHDRALHTLNIRRWLSQGRTVLCDRYYMSTIAYQGSQYIMSGGERSAWLRSINAPFMDVPDMLIYMDSDPSVAIRRIDNRGGRSATFESERFLRLTADAYKREFRAFRGRKVRIAADAPASEVREETLSAIRQAMELN